MAKQEPDAKQQIVTCHVKFDEVNDRLDPLYDVILTGSLLHHRFPVTKLFWVR